MLPQLHDVTEDLEAGVLDLFRRQDVPAREEYWLRALSSGLGGSGHAAVLDGRVLAFAMARPRTIVMEGEELPCQVLHDFIADATPDGEAAARVLLEELPRRSAVNLAIGWSPAGCQRLAENGWRFAMPVPRMLLEPKRRGGRSEPQWLPASLLPQFMEEWNAALIRDRARFLMRPAGYDRAMAEPVGSGFKFLAVVPENSAETSYLKLRRVPGAGKQEEWHLLDAAVSSKSAPAAAERLRALAEASGLPVFMSALNRSLEEALVQAGAVPVRPRWSLHWTLGSLEYKHLGRFLIDKKAPWILSPADGDLD